MRVEKKKESWIDKLIELLNEYEDWMFSWVKEYSEEFGVFILNTEQMIEEEIIISKSFGFIKWLVQNDKIDWRKFLGQWYEIAGIDWRWEDTYILETFDDYEQLLMYLAIQDNPISFLTSVLK